MIFMSQSGLIDSCRQADWDRWYVEHLRIMRTVPGMTSAQRFTTTVAGYPPSLAMYSIASESVFHDPYYLSVRGMAEWKPLIDTRFYHRNLFDGLGHAPVVANGHFLIVADRTQPDPTLASKTWLKAVALDMSTPYRGIAFIDVNRKSDFDGVSVGIYAPVAT